MSESTPSFDDLNLAEPLRRALHRQGYTTPTPIQAEAIPVVMDRQDVLGCAQTGTGKTAAFALPILHQLCPPPTQGKPRKHKPALRALILAPTRELAAQIHESFKEYGHYTKLKTAVIFGGVSQHPQVKALVNGVDILIATPGRLMDLYEQGAVGLDHIETFVLDEADRMLDMGFIKDIRRILTYMPRERQNLLFSATMPKPIRELADAILVDPVSIQVAPQTSSAAETVEQHICLVENAKKSELLSHLLHTVSVSRAIVFTRTKIRADRLTRSLKRQNIEAEAIHSDKSQQARTRALSRFKRGDLHVLVASDIAARGVDVDDISHVFNFDMPGDSETYVHRIGRTGRAGLEGTAITFVSETDEKQLRAIERLLGNPIAEMYHPYDKPTFTPQPKGTGKGSGKGRRKPQKKRAAHPFKKREAKKAIMEVGEEQSEKPTNQRRKKNVTKKPKGGKKPNPFSNQGSNPKKKPKNNKRRRPPRQD
ncbi:MAG: DEAD/DEAH box helicase [Phycisphaeraceae bacterium JB051]